MNKTKEFIQDKLYPLKVWITTIISGSLLFTVYDFLNSVGGNFNDSFRLFLGLVVANTTLSLPGAFIYFVAFWGLNNSNLSIIAKKWMLVSIAFCLILFTWYGVNTLFERDVFFSSKSLFIYVDFLFCITVSSFLFGRTTIYNKSLAANNKKDRVSF